MLNFVICDDNQQLLASAKEIVNNFMMNFDMEYQVWEFQDYGQDFQDLAKKEIGFKIYLLSTQMKSSSGLDAIRYIRKTIDDWVSVIIVLSKENQIKYNPLNEQLLLLAYINKMNNNDQQLVGVLTVAMKNYSQRPKTLSFEYDHILYRVEYKDIIYIEKEPETKLCKVKSTYAENYIGSSLYKIATDLEKDKRFLKVSRSLIVNLDQIASFDLSDNVIIFKNKERSYLVSRNYKQKLIKSLRSKN